MNSADFSQQFLNFSLENKAASHEEGIDTSSPKTDNVALTPKPLKVYYRRNVKNRRLQKLEMEDSSSGQL